MLSKHRGYFFLVAGFWWLICKISVDIQNSLENRSGNKLVCGSGYNRVGCSGSWPPDASITLSLHSTAPPPPHKKKKKPGLPDDFCRPSVREYNLWVVPALNLKRTPVGDIIVDPLRGVGWGRWGGTSRRKMKELLSLMILKWEQVFSSISDRSKFPLMWVRKVPCGDTYNFLTLSGVSFQ